MNIKSFLAKKSTFIWSIIVPTVLFYAFFRYFPVVFSLIMSFFQWNPLSGPGDFIGLLNYINALSPDFHFLTSLGNSFVFSLTFVLIRATLALGLALILHGLPRSGKSFFRAAFFIPVVCSLVAVSTIWGLILQNRFGILNSVLRSALALVGQSFKTIRWTQDPNTAMVTVVAVVIWKLFGYNLILFLVGLESIPVQYYEAAKIDGASGIKLFRHITFPLLLPITLVVMVIGMITAMQMFVPMYILTGGGPMYKTTTAVYLIYREAFESYHLGFASAISFLLFIVIMTFTLVQMRLVRVDWTY